MRYDKMTPARRAHVQALLRLAAKEFPEAPEAQAAAVQLAHIIARAPARKPAPRKRRG